MKQLDADIASAVGWLVDISLELTRGAIAHTETSERLLDKALVVAACAELPGDMPLRVRLTPYVFGFKA